MTRLPPPDPRLIAYGEGVTRTVEDRTRVKLAERQQRLSSAEFMAMVRKEYRGGGKDSTGIHNRRRTPDPAGGRDFDSTAELKHATTLKLEQSLGLILGFDRQVRLPIEPEGVRLTVYIADFVVHLLDGRHRIDECKGVWTDYALLKAKAFRLYWLPKHPDYEYRVLGGRGGNVRRQRKGKR